MTVQIFF